MLAGGRFVDAMPLQYYFVQVRNHILQHFPASKDVLCAISVYCTMKQVRVLICFDHVLNKMVFNVMINSRNRLKCVQVDVNRNGHCWKFGVSVCLQM